MIEVTGNRELAPKQTGGRCPTINSAGIVLGSTIVTRRFFAENLISLEAERTLCLLSILGRAPAQARVLEGLQQALACWDRGEKSLAHIHLAHAGLGCAKDADDVWRLATADALIGLGFAPRALAREMGIDLPTLAVRKYDPNQPRNPAGSGRASGQWTKGSIAAFAASATGIVLGRAAPSLVEPLSAGALAWVLRAAAKIAARFGLPAVAFGSVVLVPSANEGIASAGPVPGQPDLQYRLDRDTGRLTLSPRGDSDPSNALTAVLGADGIYHDVDTGVAIARAVGSMAVLVDLDRAGVNTDASTGDDEPKLCPNPQRDQPGGRREFDITYSNSFAITSIRNDSRSFLRTWLSRCRPTRQADGLRTTIVGNQTET